MESKLISRMVHDPYRCYDAESGKYIWRFEISTHYIDAVETGKEETIRRIHKEYVDEIEEKGC